MGSLSTIFSVSFTNGRWSRVGVAFFAVWGSGFVSISHPTWYLAVGESSTVNRSDVIVLSAISQAGLYFYITSLILSSGFTTIASPVQMFSFALLLSSVYSMRLPSPRFRPPPSGAVHMLGEILCKVGTALRAGDGG